MTTAEATAAELRTSDDQYDDRHDRGNEGAPGAKGLGCRPGQTTRHRNARPNKSTKRSGPDWPGALTPKARSGAAPTLNSHEGADMAERTRRLGDAHSKTSQPSVKITPLRALAHTQADPSTR